MLILTRAVGERIKIGDDIAIVVADVNGSQVRLGIDAPDGIHILREELVSASTNDSPPSSPATKPEKSGPTISYRRSRSR